MSSPNRILTSKASALAALVGIAGVCLALYAWRLPPFTSSVESTDNAYVRGAVTMISPKLDGYVAEVFVQDFMPVTAGQVLVQLDDRIYQQRLAQAKATLAAQRAALANSEQQRRSKEAGIAVSQAGVDGAEAALARASADWKRVEPLLDRGISTQAQADQSRAAFEQAQASLAQAKAAGEVARQDLASVIVNRNSLEAAVAGAEAAVRLAEIDLQNTRIVAPQDGELGEVGARLGQYVTPGTQLMAIVPDRVWIIANFKETQIARLHDGLPALMAVDALHGEAITGRIARFSPAAGSEFSVLRPDNATGNFTKVAQRIPVRIEIDPGQPAARRISPGMSVVVSVDTADGTPQATGAAPPS
ncbi:HlyD family secretion protein [Microvirga pudoricolor]|uniref:HlyD family secretion protein n=1 Tax=Microvirga pudoricolor TaxID=2778729 RepID=UPI00194FCA74|nr:HlyD family secretion protein [Microvirga pudoricolor]MBM6596628.1 HlyD family secretion protein [Microvirga pudoricolor]